MDDEISCVQVLPEPRPFSESDWQLCSAPTSNLTTTLLPQFNMYAMHESDVGRTGFL